MKVFQEAGQDSVTMEDLKTVLISTVTAASFRDLAALQGDYQLPVVLAVAAVQLQGLSATLVVVEAARLWACLGPISEEHLASEKALGLAASELQSGLAVTLVRPETAQGWAHGEAVWKALLEPEVD
ncbi:uncharacterized protein LOC144160511 [Haemaphysalis longicornis]